MAHMMSRTMHINGAMKRAKEAQQEEDEEGESAFISSTPDANQDNRESLRNSFQDSKRRRSSWRNLQNTNKTIATISMNTARKTVKLSKKAGKQTLKAAKKVRKSTRSAYKKHTVCAPCRWILKDIPHYWPRTSAILFGIFVPLWVLILLCTGLGVILTNLEHGEELSSNDSILRAQAEIAFFEVESVTLLDLPTYCLGQFFREQENTNLTTLFDAVTLGETLQECSEELAPDVALYEEVKANNSDLANRPLKFHWNRCWNETMRDYADQYAAVLHPGPELIEASRPERQEITYRDNWRESQEALFADYLNGIEYPSEEEMREAFQQSIEFATGGETCERNLGGTAWFFFTIMTTIGYGNQSPVTSEARMLIFTAGLFSIVMFGAVLGTAGYILLAIWDDLLHRIPGHGPDSWIHYPVVGAFLWFSIWFMLLIVIAVDADMWWENRLPAYEVDTPRDTIWFAFISTATVGLGDYYLQPEVMFASDTLKFSMTFLVGFVFLSTFFGKIGAMVSNIMPSRENSLETRLKKTRLLLCWKNGKCLVYGEERKKAEYDQNGDAGDDDVEYAIDSPDDCEAKTDTDDGSSNNLSAELFSTEEQRLSGLQAIFVSMEEDKKDEEKKLRFQESMRSLMKGEYSSKAEKANMSSQKKTLDLLKKEEDILRDLLDKVRTRRHRLTHGERQMDVVDEESEEIYEEDFGNVIEEELRRYSPIERTKSGAT